MKVEYIFPMQAKLVVDKIVEYCKKYDDKYCSLKIFNFNDGFNDGIGGYEIKNSSNEFAPGFNMKSSNSLFITETNDYENINCISLYSPGYGTKYIKNIDELTFDYIDRMLIPKIAWYKND